MVRKGRTKVTRATFLKGLLKVCFFLFIIQHGWQEWPVKSPLFWVSLLIKLRMCCSGTVWVRWRHMLMIKFAVKDYHECVSVGGGSRLNLTISLDWGDYSTHTHPHTASLSGLFSPSLTPSCWICTDLGQCTRVVLKEEDLSKWLFRGRGLKRIDFFLFLLLIISVVFFLFFFWVVEEHSCLLRGGGRFWKCVAWHQKINVPVF